MPLLLPRQMPLLLPRQMPPLLPLLLLLQLLAAPGGAVPLMEERLRIDEESTPELANMMELVRARLGRSASGLRFSLNMPDEFAVVDAASGVVRLRRPIDLESLCRPASRCAAGGRHEFVVLAQSSSGSTEARFRFLLEVADVNDHAPKFKKPEENISRDESVCSVIGAHCPNRKIDLPVATDADFSPQFSSVAYSIDPASVDAETKATFELRTESFGSPFLFITKGLDAERRQRYSFLLVASDSGGRRGSVRVTIFINDVNDNSPTFLQTRTVANVSEDAPVGSVVARMEAEDKDLQHKLKYQIDPSSREEEKEHFRVLDNGDVVVKKPLDYELQQQFSFMVKVEDGRFNHKAMLTVNVLDVNDNPPEYMVNGPLEVQEGADAGQRITTVQVFDRDTGAGGRVRCNESSQHRDRGRRVKFARVSRSNDFSVFVTEVLDREVDAFVTGRLVCSDLGRPSRTSTFTATVTVTDVNDNRPSFEDVGPEGVIRATVRENQRPGAGVLRLRASDLDDGENKRLVFRLVDGAGAFSVDSSSGQLTTTRQLDRETEDSYLLRVEVSDSGRPALTDSAAVSVSVADDNDHHPRISGASAFTVRENVAPPVLLGTIAAVDEDLGDNGKVLFRQLSHQHSDKFQLHPNGSLFAVKMLDREQLSQYTIPVRAYDMYGRRGSLHTDQDVTVRVMDENDNSPSIQQPADNCSRPVRISIYTHRVGAAVLRVRATDADEGDNSRLTFDVEPKPSRKFSISPDSGEIRVSAALDFNDIGPQQLLVTVHDRGRPERRSDAIIICVEVDDSAPPSPNHLDEAELAAAHTRRNVIIIVILAAVSAVLAIILIIAITCVNRPCCGMYGSQHGRAKRAPGCSEQQQLQQQQQQQQQYLEQALHLTVADSDLGGWGAGPTDRCSPTGSQSPIVTTSFAAPTHECYYGDRARLSSTTLPNPRQQTKPAGAKFGKSEQVNFWLYQIKEDACASPQTGSNFCTIARTQPGFACGQQQQQQQSDAVADGGQSDSGRGCSDEDLSSGPVYYQPATACHIHRTPVRPAGNAEAAMVARPPSRSTPLPTIQNSAASLSNGACASPPPAVDESSSRQQQQQQQQQQPLLQQQRQQMKSPLVPTDGYRGNSSEQLCRQFDNLLLKDMQV